METETRRRKNQTQSEFAAVVIQANPGWLGLIEHAQSSYIGETRVALARGHCVITKYVILTFVAWMNLHVTCQQTTPSEVHVHDFAWQPVVATNFYRISKRERI